VSVDLALHHALGLLSGERQIYAVPLRLTQWVHLTAGHLRIAKDVPESAVPASIAIARCASQRGQLVCSCGRYALVWPDPAC
jgi:hypothetical protein